MLASLVVSGCMKIYPDAELPDIETTWEVSACAPGTGDVHVVIVDYEDEVIAAESTVPCAEGAFIVADLPRRRYLVGAELLALDGTTYSGSYTSDADLRDGFGERVDLYFGSRANYRVSWRFEDGGRCASHGVFTILLEGMTTDGDFFGTLDAADCRLPPLLGTLGPDISSIRLRAINDIGATVATSPIVGVTVDPSPDGRLDLGTLLLTPCGNECP